MGAIADIIKAGSQSHLGIIALSLVGLSLITFYFFRKEHVNVKIGIFVVLLIGISLLIYSMIPPKGEKRDNILLQVESEISATWIEYKTIENAPKQVEIERITGNHHCSNDCKGEPTRTTYTLTLDKQNENGFLRNPTVKCISGPCSFSSLKEMRTFNPKLIVATFDVWSRPTTWELTAEWVTKSRTAISKKTSIEKVLIDSVVTFTIPVAAQGLRFEGITPEGGFFVNEDKLSTFTNGWIEFLNKNREGKMVHYHFQGVKPRE